MGLIAAVALIAIILASMLCVLVLRQLTRTKKSQRSPEAVLSVADVPPGYEYEVFLNFRGPDTRDNFTDCLYYRLRLAGVHVFRDNEELRVGEEIRGELLKALDKSQIYIPIFSKGYATSLWCLREVAHMVESISKSEGKKEILPIFFDVDPDDVKLKTKLYKKAISKHKKKFGSDALKRWEDALVKVAHLKGWELKGKGHGELIELVVREVLRKLNAGNVDLPEYLVEDHSQIKYILEKLEVDSDDVRYLGIHGIGGIGKTVLAKVVFNKVSSHFDGVCFLNNIRESLQHGPKSLQHGLIKLHKELLASLGGLGIVDHIKDIGDGMHRIKRVCQTKKVLIVLDDLDKQEQLKKLAGKSDWFGSGSRIIFTTRNLEILKTQVESSNEEVLNQPKGILAHEVHAMEFGRALELFCKHAFKRDSPLEGYDHLAKEIVCKVGMLPLAIEVISSHLYYQGSALEQHCDNQKLWEDTLKQLDDGPFKDVRDSLMISYEGLEIKQKEVFLDIACFFTYENQTYPIIMWNDCNYHPHSAINALHLRSLIKIVDNGFLMHDQVRDLGRQIILEEYPRKYHRVWIHEDAVNLLKKKERNEDVKALSLTSDGCRFNLVPEKSAFDGCNHNIVPKELAALPNLRFLQARGIDFLGNFKNIVSKLYWLSWEVTHNKFYAENLYFASLVVLDLSYSNIKDDWGGWSQFQQMSKKLKVLDLTGCVFLTRTPDFSNFLSLEILRLDWCIRLITIDCSIDCRIRYQFRMAAFMFEKDEGNAVATSYEDAAGTSDDERERRAL
ncbi:disease resistance protein RPV1-like [Eucalyptus grandis]|uniref:disease resistance protein RPV1-like n=1 Tax=Eucalyptus grandis TaxID=71139 RepID=UPI00192EDB8C|nr:disease resistance protein RPV1-like [Eucalyptus grandis]